MNQNCKYCGFKDKANSDHICLEIKAIKIIDRVIEDYTKEWTRAEHLQDQLNASDEHNRGLRGSLEFISKIKEENKYFKETIEEMRVNECARACRISKLEEALRTLDSRGGLGFDVHKWIKSILEN